MYDLASQFRLHEPPLGVTGRLGGVLAGKPAPHAISYLSISDGVHHYSPVIGTGCSNWTQRSWLGISKKRSTVSMQGGVTMTTKSLCILYIASSSFMCKLYMRNILHPKTSLASHHLKESKEGSPNVSPACIS